MSSFDERKKMVDKVNRETLEKYNAKLDLAEKLYAPMKDFQSVGFLHCKTAGDFVVVLFKHGPEKFFKFGETDPVPKGKLFDEMRRVFLENLELMGFFHPRDEGITEWDFGHYPDPEDDEYLEEVFGTEMVFYLQKQNMGHHPSLDPRAETITTKKGATGDGKGLEANTSEACFGLPKEKGTTIEAGDQGGEIERTDSPGDREL